MVIVKLDLTGVLQTCLPLFDFKVSAHGQKTGVYRHFHRVDAGPSQ